MTDLQRWVMDTFFEDPGLAAQPYFAEIARQRPEGTNKPSETTLDLDGSTNWMFESAEVDLRLRELIEDAEAEHGPVDRAAVEAKRAILRGE